jgi:hypothetical protein
MKTLEDRLKPFNGVFHLIAELATRLVHRLSTMGLDSAAGKEGHDPTHLLPARPNRHVPRSPAGGEPASWL